MLLVLLVYGNFSMLSDFQASIILTSNCDWLLTFKILTSYCDWLLNCWLMKMQLCYWSQNCWLMNHKPTVCYVTRIMATVIHPWRQYHSLICINSWVTSGVKMGQAIPARGGMRSSFITIWLVPALWQFVPTVPMHKYGRFHWTRGGIL